MLLLLRKGLWIAVMLVFFGGVLPPSSYATPAWEDDSENAVLFLPIKLPWYAVKFLFYELPRAAIYRLPEETANRFEGPLARKPRVAQLIEELNDEDLLVRDFLLLELRKETGQGLTSQPFSDPEQQKASVLWWNRWWRVNQGGGSNGHRTREGGEPPVKGAAESD